MNNPYEVNPNVEEPATITFQATAAALPPAHRAATDISPKVSGSALAGAVTLVLVFIANRLGLDIPVEVEGGIVVLLTALVGYLIPDRR